MVTVFGRQSAIYPTGASTSTKSTGDPCSKSGGICCCPRKKACPPSNTAGIDSRSCRVAYAHEAAALNGHFGGAYICNICTLAQVRRCAAAHQIPSRADAVAVTKLARLDNAALTLEERRISLDGSTEQQRYSMQHTLNYQVHDPRQHGRWELGWTEIKPASGSSTSKASVSAPAFSAPPHRCP